MTNTQFNTIVQMIAQLSDNLEAFRKEAREHTDQKFAEALEHTNKKFAEANAISYELSNEILRAIEGPFAELEHRVTKLEEHTYLTRLA